MPIHDWTRVDAEIFHHFHHDWITAISRMKTAYIEPVAVGDDLPDMPLFLEADQYILAPLASTYQTAWEGVPQVWREQLQPIA